MICLHCKKPGADFKKKPFHWDGQCSYVLTSPLKEFEPMNFHRACYDEWYKGLIAGLANLDEVMNYCKYFERTNGNDGFYVRDGKRCPALGQWDGYHLNTPWMAEFKNFLVENGWLSSWFEIRDAYKRYV